MNKEKLVEKMTDTMAKLIDYSGKILPDDVYQKLEELGSKEESSSYESSQFDVVTLFSVFSHMIPEDINNYLSEI